MRCQDWGDKLATAATSLTAFATINLHYAMAEIATIADRDSIMRALDHIRQAEGCLRVVMAEYDIPTDDAEPEEQSEAA
ncbi:hypothetical protein CCR94_10540 [Rhodoblastus sphagnicola]|uniref:Uncharacterized protein n=1 Tax=Rhodoblastus sphagnicola TaxID=333368 RepID=A0A2S6N8T4_9HYPH|nr:hypothetical protein [Rhodoblastus sphagnicola]MBB4200963.1 hypothetical protein [Rhodoblastus sphagnicola]PPQ31025.1 hypothetical protein CCR94_10540 [Rhodoblastus sphagnicola]